MQGFFGSLPVQSAISQQDSKMADLDPANTNHSVSIEGVKLPLRRINNQDNTLLQLLLKAILNKPKEEWLTLFEDLANALGIYFELYDLSVEVDKIHPKIGVFGQDYFNAEAIIRIGFEEPHTFYQMHECSGLEILPAEVLERIGTYLQASENTSRHLMNTSSVIRNKLVTNGARRVILALDKLQQGGIYFSPDLIEQDTIRKLNTQQEIVIFNAIEVLISLRIQLRGAYQCNMDTFDRMYNAINELLPLKEELVNSKIYWSILSRLMFELIQKTTNRQQARANYTNSDKIDKIYQQFQQISESAFHAGVEYARVMNVIVQHVYAVRREKYRSPGEMEPFSNMYMNLAEQIKDEVIDSMRAQGVLDDGKLELFEAKIILKIYMIMSGGECVTRSGIDMSRFKFVCRPNLVEALNNLLAPINSEDIPDKQNVISTTFRKNIRARANPEQDMTAQSDRPHKQARTEQDTSLRNDSFGAITNAPALYDRPKSEDERFQKICQVWKQASALFKLIEKLLLPFFEQICTAQDTLNELSDWLRTVEFDISYDVKPFYRLLEFLANIKKSSIISNKQEEGVFVFEMQLFDLITDYVRELVHKLDMARPHGIFKLMLAQANLLMGMLYKHDEIEVQLKQITEERQKIKESSLEGRRKMSRSVGLTNGLASESTWVIRQIAALDAKEAELKHQHSKIEHELELWPAAYSQSMRYGLTPVYDIESAEDIEFHAEDIEFHAEDSEVYKIGGILRM